MIIEYDRSPNATVEQRLNSLANSVMRAFEMLGVDEGIPANGSAASGNVGLADRDFIADVMYPIGSVIASVNPDFNPNKVYPKQIWVRFAEGRTLVGVDEADPLFSEAERVCGEQEHVLSTEELPSHEHTISGTAASGGAHTHPMYIRKNCSVGGSAWKSGSTSDNEGSVNSRIASAGAHTHTLSGTAVAAGGSEAHNNIQPSIAVYYWKRVAEGEGGEVTNKITATHDGLGNVTVQGIVATHDGAGNVTIVY